MTFRVLKSRHHELSDFSLIKWFFTFARFLQQKLKIIIILGFPTIKVTGKFVKYATDNLHRPVTFKSKHTFVGLPMLRAYSSIHIDFMFKTREANGLIMFNGGKKEDFVAVELVDGHINYVVNVGDGTVTLRDTVRYTGCPITRILV